MIKIRWLVVGRNLNGLSEKMKIKTSWLPCAPDFELSGNVVISVLPGSVYNIRCCSDTQLCPSLRPHGLQHTGLPCPSLFPGACSNSCLLSRWCHPNISSSVVPFSSCPQSFQHQGLFQWVSSSHQVTKVWRVSSSISPSNEYSGLISFRMDWLDLLVVQGTLKSLLQHCSLKASILIPGNLFSSVRQCRNADVLGKKCYYR